MLCVVKVFVYKLQCIKGNNKIHARYVSNDTLWSLTCYFMFVFIKKFSKLCIAFKQGKLGLMMLFCFYTVWLNKVYWYKIRIAIV